MDDRAYIDNLDQVGIEDVLALKEKDKEYGGSWKRRGGPGAFMMLARKWDRIEQNLSQPTHIVNRSRSGKDNVVVGQYDIFAAIEADERKEGIIDDIRDLRRYLMLVEAEAIARGIGPYAPPKAVAPAQQPAEYGTPIPERFGDRRVPRHDDGSEPMAPRRERYFCTRCNAEVQENADHVCVAPEEPLGPDGDRTGC